jgi:hypothetical protein
VIDILSIPAMNAESKRVFFRARRNISWERMQLKNENIEKIEYLKSWMRNGLTLNVEIENSEVN